jgi:4-hydroxy-tetrahydrodipicolinate synthase
MDFNGTMVALVTPFRNGSVDRSALRALVEHVIAGGVAGVVPCGTTGESPTLSQRSG